jgi:DNA-binding response OmpR family regulator
MTAILVAEDDPNICDLLTDILEVELYATVRCERTGRLALRAIETAAFDLAIIDVNLPEISGYELAMRAANRNLPALLSSGHPNDDAKLRKYEFPYLAKPYRVGKLISEAAIAITQAGEKHPSHQSFLRQVGSHHRRPESRHDRIRPADERE